MNGCSKGWGLGKKNRNDIRQSVCVKNGLAVSISLFFILGEALCIAFHDIFPGADGVEQAIIGGYAKIDRINDCICVRIKKYGYGIARVAGTVDDAMYSWGKPLVAPSRQKITDIADQRAGDRWRFDPVAWFRPYL